jgi:hypothetical protein
VAGQATLKGRATGAGAGDPKDSRHPEVRGQATLSRHEVRGAARPQGCATCGVPGQATSRSRRMSTGAGDLKGRATLEAGAATLKGRAASECAAAGDLKGRAMRGCARRRPASAAPFFPTERTRTRAAALDGDRANAASVSTRAIDPRTADIVRREQPRRRRLRGSIPRARRPRACRTPSLRRRQAESSYRGDRSAPACLSATSPSSSTADEVDRGRVSYPARVRGWSLIPRSTPARTS